MDSLRSRTGLAVILLAAAAGLLAAAAPATGSDALAWTLAGLCAGAGLALLIGGLGRGRLERRIERLAASVDAWQSDGLPLPAADVDAGGDAVARLAAQFERAAEQIAQQRAALDQAARQRTELLANVSHDLRTPLASMQGYLELLLLRDDELAPGEARAFLQTAARQSERLGRLVGDLFELTRLESGETHAHKEPVALAELAQDVVQKFAPDAQRREVTLGTNCAGAVAPAAALQVLADIGLLERVLDSLVENALRHTPPGGAVTIEIDGDEQQAQLAVRDTGVGIAAADMPGLFDRYDRAARVGAEASSGPAGLGLAIARRIVALHGSRLDVASPPGQGTRVSFRLARARGRDAALQRHPPNDQSAA